MTLLDKPHDGEWVEGPPPESKAGPGLWQRRLAPLRENPQRWARFGPYAMWSAGKQVSRINGGMYGPGFTSRIAREEDRDWVYVCFDPTHPPTEEAMK